MAEPVTVRIIYGHQDVGDFPDYHEWINSGRHVKANSRGVPNPRMYSANWQKWICNNTDCSAFAFVNELAIGALLDATGGGTGEV